eukprot:3939558-Rhodomonas_salina.2
MSVCTRFRKLRDFGACVQNCRAISGAVSSVSGGGLKHFGGRSQAFRGVVSNIWALTTVLDGPSDRGCVAQLPNLPRDHHLAPYNSVPTTLCTA